MADREHDHSPHQVEGFEERMIERESSGTSLIAYAAIKYFSWVIIVIAILYFLARYVLPMLS
ncbi:MAG TPA: hypothetical protein VF282_11145 [Bacillota bacterium]